MTQSVLARRIVGERIFEIDTAKDRLDIGLVHDFLAHSSHWALGIGRDVVERSIANSRCFGLYRDGEQIGFARVVTDEATFAYLTDVFVVAGVRNAGLGQWLVETVLAHPPLQRLRRWLLMTSKAASLYRRCGFTDPTTSCTPLERLDADVYTTLKAAAD
jgi:N-acetylglutamate synthase-like GNAT family acetyltransferase